LIKHIEFYGKTLKIIKDFAVPVRHEIGHALERVQRGLEPLDWKPVPVVGKGVREIRVQERGQYRVIYVAKYKNTIHVLHVFRKKTRKTGSQDIKAARVALREILARN